MAGKFKLKSIVQIMLATTLVTAFFTGCTTSSKDSPTRLLPISSTNIEPFKIINSTPNQPVIALVLGGGGLRGFAHLGVIKALHESGLPIDLVVGTSVGALVGAAYASGLTPEQIEILAREIDIASLMDLTFSKSGIMRGLEIESWLNDITHHIPVEQFPIRFAAVATELQSEQAVLLNSGAAGEAVRASSAVPGVTIPVPYYGGYLIDGGVTSLVPVRFARALGADIVIAVDIYCNTPRKEGMSAISVIQKVMHTQSCLIAHAEMKEADVLISPRVSISGISAESEQIQAIQIGYETALSTLPLVDRSVRGFHLKEYENE